MAQKRFWGDFPPDRKAYLILSAVIGFVGTVFFSFALVFLIRFVLPRHLPNEAKPGQLSLSFLILSSLATVLWPPSLIRQEFD